MYSFYFGKLLLPVTPGKLTVTINNNNEIVNLADTSPINFLKSPGLTDISFEALIPVWQKYPFARYNETDQEQFLDWANDHGYRVQNSDLLTLTLMQLFLLITEIIHLQRLSISWISSKSSKPVVNHFSLLFFVTSRTELYYGTIIGLCLWKNMKL